MQTTFLLVEYCVVGILFWGAALGPWGFSNIECVLSKFSSIPIAVVGLALAYVSGLVVNVTTRLVLRGLEHRIAKGVFDEVDPPKEGLKRHLRTIFHWVGYPAPEDQDDRARLGQLARRRRWNTLSQSPMLKQEVDHLRHRIRILGGTFVVSSLWLINGTVSALVGRNMEVPALASQIVAACILALLSLSGWSRYTLGHHRMLSYFGERAPTADPPWRGV